jgi:anti-anti-sigma factor
VLPSWEPSNKALVVSLHGDLDMATADLVVAAGRLAVERGAERLVFDLADVDFVDSYGSKSLVAVATALMRSGTSVELDGPSKTVRMALRTSGLDAILEVRP